MLELDKIVFAADTTALDAAITKMGVVATAITKLSDAQTKAAVNSNKVAISEEKLQKEQAANTIKQIDLENKKAKAVENSSKVIEASTGKVTNALEHQTSVLGYMVKGYSRGQSGILSTAKAAGLATTELSKLGEVLQSQRTLIGNDPFDKSLGALRALKNEYSVVREQVRLYNAELGLSKNQSADLARDKLRLIEQSKIEGKSVFATRDAIKSLNTEYIKLATAENSLITSHKANQKATTDTVKANAYLETEMHKVTSAIGAAELSLNRTSSNALVKFQSALKQSGKTLAEQTVLMNKYKAAQVSLAGSDSNRKVDHLSRALAPQITDISVGLATGQPIFTTLLQQMGQVRDQIGLSGLEASRITEALRNSIKQMATSLLDVGKAVSTGFVSAFYDAGKGLKNLILDVTGLNSVLEYTRYQLTLAANEGSTFAKVLLSAFNGLGKAATAVFAVGIVGAVAAIVSLGVALKQVIQQENELSKAVELSGGSMGLTNSIAQSYVTSLGAISGSSTLANEAIIAMAKNGDITSSRIMMVGEAAIRMNKVLEVPIDETIKRFGELAKSPTEALIKIAKETGLVSIATLEQVRALEAVGDKTEAARAASEAYEKVTKDVTTAVKTNYGTLTQFAKEVGSVFTSMWDKILGVGRTDNNKDFEDRVAKLKKQIADNASGAFSYRQGTGGQEAEGKQLQIQLDTLLAQNLAQKNQGILKEQQVKDAAKLEYFEDLRVKHTTDVTKKTEELIKLKGELASKGKLTDAQELIAKSAIAKLESDITKAKKSEAGTAEKDPTKSFYASSMSAFTDASIKAKTAQDDLTVSQIKLMEITSDPKWKLMSEARKLSVMETAAATIKEEQYARSVQDSLDAEELYGKLLGKSSGIGKEYYATLDKIVGYRDSGARTEEQMVAMIVALTESTTVFKSNEAAIKGSKEELKKFNDESDKTLNAAKATSNDLDFQLSLMGKTTEEQKLMNIEHSRTNELIAIEIELAKTLRDIRESTKFTVDEVGTKQRADAEANAIKAAAEKTKVVNKGVATQFRLDFQKEIDKVNDDLTDAIVTALFEGGEAGSKKLRDMLVAELRKQVTMSVNVVVSSITGAALNAVGLGSNSSGSTLVNAGLGALLGGSTSVAALGSAFGEGAMATMTGSSFANASTVGMFSGGGAAGAGVMGSIGAAAPYIAAAYAVYSLINGGGFTSTSSTGYGVREYGADGSLVSSQTDSGGIGQAADALDGLNASFQGVMKSLGATGGATFTYNSNTGKEGADPQFYIKSGSYDSGEIQKNADNVALATSRAIFTAMQDSTLPKYLEGAFDNMVAGSMSLDQINEVVAGAHALKVFNDQLMLFPAPLKSLADLSFSTTQMLIGFSGLLENLQTNLSNYYDKFYTDSEKTINSTANLNKAFADLNIIMPTIDDNTRAWYRSEVERLGAMDLSVESNAKAYASILGLSSAVDSLTPTFDDVAKAVESTAAALRNTAIDSLEVAISAQQDILTTQKGILEESITSLSSVFELLSSSVDSLYDQVQSTTNVSYTQGRATILGALNASRNGILPTTDGISGAITAVNTGLSSGNFASQIDLDRERLIVAGQLAEMRDTVGVQLTIDEQLLAELEDQSKQLDETLAYWKEQISIADGTFKAVLSVADAIIALKGLLFPSNNSGTSGNGSGSTSGVEVVAGPGASTFTTEKYADRFNLMGTIMPSYIDDAERIGKLDSISEYLREGHSIDEIADAAKKYNVTLRDLAAAGGYTLKDVENAFEGKGIPSYDIGTNYVPRDTLAKIHEGEAIIPKAYNPSAVGVSSDKRVDTLEAALVETNKLLKEISDNSKKTKDILNTVTDGGEGMINQ